MTEECSKYGTVAAIEIPHVGGAGAGVGFVFVKYHTREDAQKVRGADVCLVRSSLVRLCTAGIFCVPVTKAPIPKLSSLSLIVNLYSHAGRLDQRH